MRLPSMVKVEEAMTKVVEETLTSPLTRKLLTFNTMPTTSKMRDYKGDRRRRKNEKYFE